MDDILRFARENTVSAEQQVNDVIVRSMGEGRPRILFVGNSITLHGVRPEVGWYNLWGMAASEREKDYVHQAMHMVRGKVPSAEYMIAQAASWEIAYWQGEEGLKKLTAAQEYDPDIVIVNLGENVNRDRIRQYDLTEAFAKMLDFFNPAGRARMIVADCFWPDPEKDACIREAARQKNARTVKLGHLGVRDDMKAIGLFEHSGVAAHPGDLGMLRIAEAIYSAMEPMLEEEWV